MIMNRIRAIPGSVGGGARCGATALAAAAIALAATAVRAEFDVAAARGRLVLADEPAGALSLTAAKGCDNHSHHGGVMQS